VNCIQSSLCVPDQSDMVLQIKELEKDLRSLTCELAHVKSNGEEGYGHG
jgi:hypothetical protein